LPPGSETGWPVSPGESSETLALSVIFPPGWKLGFAAGRILALDPRHSTLDPAWAAGICRTTSTARPDQWIRKADRIKRFDRKERREHKDFNQGWTRIFSHKEAQKAQNKSEYALYAHFVLPGGPFNPPPPKQGRHCAPVFASLRHGRLPPQSKTIHPPSSTPKSFASPG